MEAAQFVFEGVSEAIRALGLGEEQAKRVGEMYDYWYTLRNPTGETGELDIALKESDIEQISEILAKMIPINQEFLEMAADRFTDLVAKKL